MPTKKLACAACLFLLACGLAGALSSSVQDPTNVQGVVERARKSYYNLRSEGLQSLECTLTPDWERVLEESRKRHAAGVDAAVKSLNLVHYAITVGNDGQMKITHRDAPDKETAVALQQMYGSMESMTLHFWETWSGFMLYSPFRHSKGHQFKLVGPQKYQLIFKPGNDAAEVVGTLDEDFAITTITYSSPTLHNALQPTFTKTSRGLLLLSSYEQVSEIKNPEEITKFKASITYQEVDGLQLLRTVDFSGSYNAGPFAERLTFSNCNVTKKTASN